MKKYTFISDLGGLLVGNDQFQLRLESLCDSGWSGEHTVYVVKKHGKKIDKTNLRFVGCAEGNFNIYKFDINRFCDGDIIVKLNGRFGIFGDPNRGSFLFEEW